MKKNLTTHTDEQTISHLNLRSRFGAAFLAGCLALSVCPTLAFAATSANGAEQGNVNGNPPAAMQFDAGTVNDLQQGPQQGQAPSGFTQGEAPEMGQAPEGMPGGEAPDFSQAPEGAPEGEAPDFQMQNGQAPNMQAGELPSGELPSGQAPDMQAPNGNEPRTDAMSEQVKQILAETYGITLPAFGESEPTGDFQPGNMGAPDEAPELPDGIVNVQQVIDTARDILREYSATDLQDKIGDADFVAALKAYALSATEQRLAMFASNERPTMEAPSDLPSDQAAAPTDAPDGAAPGEAVDGAPEGTPNGTAPGDAVDGTLMSQIISLIMDVFGYVAS